ncbi:DUF6789 family protein [Streptomyces sp. NPDC001435]|jgi:hypothetical protein|uniref:DUF6789 family protein n=1 Tax=unclassified Streptomyces TaxID=2593676 RepID=UPI0036893B6A
MATTVQVSQRTAVIPVHAIWGAAAGVVGGIGMGVWMSVSRPMMDTAVITMIAGLLGSKSAVIGWVIHLAIAVLAGTGFGVLLGHLAQKLAPAAVLGLIYGTVWWVLGALWIMPANMHLPVFAWNAVTSSSLGAHLAYGLLLGLVFSCIAQAMARRTGSVGR